MPDELCLPILAAAVLLWYLVCALRQVRDEHIDGLKVVWREAGAAGWTDWADLDAVPASAGYDAILCAVREHAESDSTGVHFAIVTHPADAPAFTLRVVFMSAVRERSAVRELVTTGGEG